MFSKFIGKLQFRNMYYSVYTYTPLVLYITLYYIILHYIIINNVLHIAFLNTYIQEVNKPYQNLWEFLDQIEISLKLKTRIIN